MASKVKTTKYVPQVTEETMSPKMESSILNAAKPVVPGGDTNGDITIDKEGAITKIRIDYGNSSYINIINFPADPFVQPKHSIEVGTRGPDGKDKPLASTNNRTSNGTWHRDAISGKEADPKLISSGVAILKAAGVRTEPVVLAPANNTTRAP
jgi:hypothetical protein